jgi:hypothetical protein
MYSDQAMGRIMMSETQPSQENLFSLLQTSMLALRPIQLPIPWVPGVLSPWVKWLEHETDQSPPSCSEAKNKLSHAIYHPPSIPSWHGQNRCICTICANKLCLTLTCSLESPLKVSLCLANDILCLQTHGLQNQTHWKCI